jgi:UDP-N-acetylmuramate dehydrogenase
MTDFVALARELEKGRPALRLLKDEPLKNHTSFRIGGKAALVSLPETPEDLAFLLKTAKKFGARSLVMGLGSNLLFNDGLIPALIVKTTGMAGITADGTKITALAGAPLPVVSSFAQKKGLSGLAFAQGIPGSVGGGVTMNAGAYGYDISMICEKVSCLSSETLAEGSFEGKELTFGYRRSAFTERKDLVVTSAVFSLEQGDKEKIKCEMEDYAARRKASQPLDLPSAGSVFKRPEGYFAGKLVDDCGLKGLRVGGAMVSTKHAGFIVNVGDATCADVLELIEKIQETVYCRYGIELECEIQYFG